MTSLVTGGNGFIGQALVRELVERGEEVVVFDAQDRAEQLDSLDKKVMFVQGDLAELSDVSSVVKQYRPQTIFHLLTQRDNAEFYFCLHNANKKTINL